MPLDWSWGGVKSFKITRMAPHTSLTALHDRLAAHTDTIFPQALDHLSNLIAIPSLSLPSAPDGPVEDSARAVRELFLPLADWDFFDIVRADGGRPAVLGRKNPQPGRPTILLYAHHDVQPAGESDKWSSDPFRAEIRDGRLFGRGSADDGAGIVTHWQALRYLSTLTADWGGLGVVLFIEGEEESGSPTFSSLLDIYRDVLRSDVLIVADSDNPSPTTPALTTSLRGVVGMTVTVRTGQFPLHSGMFGGAVPDAPTALVRLLATLHDERGNPTLRFDAPPDKTSREMSEKRFREESGVLPGVSLLGEGQLTDRLWWSPAITVTGFDAPATSHASNTLWPEASARISMRIPPGASPDTAVDALSRHLHDNAPWGAEVTLSRVERGPGFVGPVDHPHVSVYAECAEQVFGEPLQFQGVGGTIPFISELSGQFPQSVVMVTGVEDPESRAHGIDESVDVGMLERAGLTEGLFLARLSQLG